MYQASMDKWIKRLQMMVKFEKEESVLQTGISGNGTGRVYKSLARVQGGRGGEGRP